MGTDVATPAYTIPVAHLDASAEVMSETLLMGNAPSAKYTVPATLLVTTTALGSVPPVITVGDKETKGINVAAGAAVVVVADANEALLVTPTRTHVFAFPTSHALVTDQRSTPDI